MQAVDLLEKLQKYLELEWIYEQKSEQINAYLYNLEAKRHKNYSSPVKEILPSTEEALTKLYELALKGRIKSLKQQLDQLVISYPELSPFAQEIYYLCQEFQIDKIQIYIKKILNNN